MFQEAYRNPDSYRFLVGKSEVKFAGEKNVTDFENSSEHQFGIYRILDTAEETLGFWNGSCLYLGTGASWRIRIKEKVQN